ncbi:hypothetical protein F2Q69_00030831 [Brassica cretica]|uniref:Uncharacterized protein n=1 Tax=Brassica cretica TaxID=69181 RepID=A0A8S9RSC8_BRACR|nr:hypothetical protein F2Q69_00030831 [Brassica cretica]
MSRCSSTELASSTAAKTLNHTLKTFFFGTPNKRQIPAITINMLKLYAHCRTPTTLHNGSGLDLQLIGMNTPCSLLHTDESTICGPRLTTNLPTAAKAPTTYTGPYPYGNILRAGSQGFSIIETGEYIATTCLLLPIILES